mgnify:CR=1 FL=1|jgi:hypothetical protein
MTENILFWLKNDFTYLGIAQKLKNNFNFEIFGIVDGSKPLMNFFDSQKIVNFNKTWNFYQHVKSIHPRPDEKYLTKFEKKYNLNLQKYISNEPLFSKSNNFYKFSSQEIFSIIQHECELFESILEHANPSFFVAKDSWFFETEWEPLHHFQLFYDLCLAKKIKILLLNQPNIGNKSIISQHNHTIDYLESLDNITNFKKILDLKHYLKSYDLSKQNQDYVKRNNLSLTKKISKFSNKNNSSQYFLQGRTNVSLSWFYLKSFFLKKNRKKFIDENSDQQIDFKKQYVYFPLSVDDEKEILFSDPLSTNQFKIIKNVAKYLPKGYQLFIKEHPNQLNHNWRPVSFYKELLDIPNVKLIHPNVSTEKLFENCSLVITISGSSGFEAAFYKKPSMLFSDLGYSILSSVNVVKTLDDLSNSIQHSISTKIDEDELSKYISELEKNCFEFDSYAFYDAQQNYFLHDDIENFHEFSLKIKSYLNKNSTIFEKLSIEFHKKILQHNSKNENSSMNLVD